MSDAMNSLISSHYVSGYINMVLVIYKMSVNLYDAGISTLAQLG